MKFGQAHTDANNGVRTPTREQLQVSQKKHTRIMSNIGAATPGGTTVTFGTAGGVLGVSGIGALVGVNLLDGAAVTGILAGGMALGPAFSANEHSGGTHRNMSHDQRMLTMSE